MGGELLTQTNMEKEMLELEFEAREALLEKERNHAQRICNNVKKLGCALDAEDWMRSTYAKDALNGAHGKCSITVNYENSLAIPVGGIVYARDAQQSSTRIVAPFS